MSIDDKKNVLKKVHNGELIEIELGCGNRKRMLNAIGIDMLDYDCVDIVGDVFNVLREFPDASVSAVYSFHFVEHIDDLSMLMDELARVLTSGGSVHIVVPHFSNPYFYSDYTHKTFFGLYTFCYLCESNLFKRNVPSYKKSFQFKLTAVDLVFKSTRPFYLRHAMKFVVGKVFNFTGYTKELYEENFCYMFPCYEIDYRLVRVNKEKL